MEGRITIKAAPHTRWEKKGSIYAKLFIDYDRNKKNGYETRLGNFLLSTAHEDGYLYADFYAIRGEIEASMPNLYVEEAKPVERSTVG